MVRAMSRYMHVVGPLVVALGVAPLTACEPEPDPISILVEEECEGTNPMNCALPWPSDRWLVDGSLQYDPAAIPLNKDGDPFDVEPYAIRDGFSPSSTIMTMFATDVDLDNTPGMPVEGSWELSVADDSPTVIVDLVTGDRIAHFAEIDRRAHEDESPGQLVPDPTLFYLRPAVRLQDGRDYGVAIRNVQLIDGTVPEAFPAFAALRDAVITNAPTIEDRRDGYEEMFEVFASAGVERETLQQAWRFRTSSGDNVRRDLIAMRDDALERVPVGGGSCTATEVREDFDDRAFRRVDGTFEVPLYMDSEYTGSRVVRGADGLPEFQGWTTADFTLLIPHSLAQEGADPGPLLGFGHGLMGSASGEGGGGFLRGFGNDYGMVSVATNWAGMSEDDITTVAIALSEVGTFPSTGERLMQGMINMIVMIRSFHGACATMDELLVDGRQVIDTDEEPYFMGISQGGIFGGTVMALTPDVSKGALLVGAMNYPLMIGRSVDFYDYEVVYKVWYPERVDREILMSLMISMWDFAEPNPWIPLLMGEPPPGGEPRQILYQIAKDDSQVPNVASDIAVRTMGIPMLSPTTVDAWGIETAAGPVPSAYVYYDLQREPAPEGNEAPLDGNGAHGDQRYIPAAREQLNRFFQPDGVVEDFCGGPCLFE